MNVNIFIEILFAGRRIVQEAFLHPSAFGDAAGPGPLAEFVRTVLWPASKGELVLRYNSFFAWSGILLMI